MVKVTYELNEAGRRASLLAGGNGKMGQVVEIAAGDPLYRAALDMAEIDTDGNATIAVSGYLSADRVIGNRSVAGVTGSQFSAPMNAYGLVAHESARWESIRAASAEKIAAEAVGRAARLAADPHGSEWINRSNYHGWTVCSCVYAGDDIDAVRAVAQAECDRRNAAEAIEKERAEAEAVAKKTAARDRLREWASVRGSGLVQLRMAEGFDSWVPAARSEFIDATANAVGTDSADVPDGYEFSRADDRESPTVEEIKLLRSIRDRLPECATVELIYCTYTPEADADDYDNDAPTIHRTELRVTVTTPDGSSGYRDYLIPTGVASVK